MNNTINHRPLFFDKIEEFTKVHPDYTIGEVLYSVLKQLPNYEVTLDKRKYLLTIEDSQFYTGVDRAIRSESER